jgi:pimeloyl-ACP methyl ester carboxylesterase
MNNDVAYGQSILGRGIRSRFVNGVNGLTMHILEAGFEESGRPCVVLLHGFPELAFSWRKQILPLAEAGFHVVAPDQRGYGRTTGWDPDYDGDVGSFRLLNIVNDTMALVLALGHETVAAVVGHDFGSPVAAYCALVRPDIFRSVVLMSAPFTGPPALPFDTANNGSETVASKRSNIHDDLAQLSQPRKHYRWYYSERSANDNMSNCDQGVHNFLRGYYHLKSADWRDNRPYPLTAWTAEELAKLPGYYVMNLNEGMAETVARDMPTVEEIASCEWLTEGELAVYAKTFTRTGFQGGLQWYRCGTNPVYSSDLLLFSGHTIDVPCLFLAGASDWGVYQVPNAIKTMQSTACTDMRGVELVKGAGHWVQQEQSRMTNDLLLAFLD